MSNFALDTNSSYGDVISSLNYALSNLGGGGGLNVNNTTGQITNSTTGVTVSYLYQYMDVKYANSSTGSSGFSSNSQYATYYGLRNTANLTISNNPVDYVWSQVGGGGFGNTRTLWYQTLGGRQIGFTVSNAAPNQYNLPAIDNTPINLDIVTTITANANISSVYTTNIYQRNTIQPATPTGGFYDFGNLILTPPTGWYANVPQATGGNVWSSTNTFKSNLAISPPVQAWSTPSLFAANGVNGTNGTNGNNGISSFSLTAYALDSIQPATPQTNTGSWNFGTSVGTPPTDPNSVYLPYEYIQPATITVSNNNPANVAVYSNTIVNGSLPLISNTYYTFFATTYHVGNVNPINLSVNYTKGYLVDLYDSSTYLNGQYGNSYVNTFTITGNVVYADIMLIGAGGDGDNLGNYAKTSGGSNFLEVLAGGDGGETLVVANVALYPGTYYVSHGAGAGTTLYATGTASPLGDYNLYANPGNSGWQNGQANIGGGKGGNITVLTNGTQFRYNDNSNVQTRILGNVGYPNPILYQVPPTNANAAVAQSAGSNGGTGQTLLSNFSDINWIGVNPSGYTWPNGAAYSGSTTNYFTAGGASSITNWASQGLPAVSPQRGGLGGGGIGEYSVGGGGGVTIAGNAIIGTGSGGGGGENNNVGNNYLNTHYMPTRYQSNQLGGLNTFGSPGAAIIKVRNPLSGNPNTVTWTLTQPTPTSTLQVYSSSALATSTNANANVTTLTWSTPTQITSNGIQGNRGFIPLAYILTVSDPTNYTNAQYTAAFSAPRTNTSPPIGTGYAPIAGDTAQFFYSNPSLPNGGISAFKTFNGSVWTDVDGTVIDGNVLVSGTITSSKLAANDIFTLNLQSTNATFGNVNSQGFWMSSANGDARFGGNVSIGANLNVQGLITGGGLNNSTVFGNTIANLTITNVNIQNNTITGNNVRANTITANNLVATDIYALNVISSNATFGNVNSQGFWLSSANGDARFGGNISVGDNLTVGNNAKIGGSLTIGNNLKVGQNAVIGGNLNIGDNASVGNNLSVGNNMQIGGNLNVTGLITTGALQANTVSTNNLQYGAVTSNQMAPGAAASGLLITGNSFTSFNSITVSSPTTDVWYDIGCNVSITTTKTSKFIISSLESLTLNFSSTSSTLYFYTLASRVKVTDPSNNVTFLSNINVPVEGSDNASSVTFPVSVPQRISLSSYTTTGTYNFALQMRWSNNGYVTNTPTSLLCDGGDLTVQAIYP